MIVGVAIFYSCYAVYTFGIGLSAGTLAYIHINNSNSNMSSFIHGMPTEEQWLPRTKTQGKAEKGDETYLFPVCGHDLRV